MATAAWPQLTLITGPPGSGKTHLARASVHPDRSMYVTLRDQYDGSELPARLVRVIKARVPALPGWLSAAVGPSCGPVSDHDPLRRAEQLGSLIGQAQTTHLHRPTTLVIDELERIDHDPTAMRLVESLVRATPELLSIVLVTRTGIPFPVNRLRGDERVLTIGEDDLAVGDDTARSIVRGRWPDLAEYVHELTAMCDRRPGAILAVAALLASHDRSERAELLTEVAETARDHDSDVSTAAIRLICRQLDDDHRALVDDLAIVRRANLPELERLGHEHAENSITTLVASGIVERAAGGSDIVRLGRDASAVVAPRSAIARQRAPAAVRAAVGRGDPINAVHIAATHGTGDLVRDTVVRFGTAAIDAGGGRLVLDAIDALGDPSLGGIAGRAAQALGLWERAIIEYERAAEVEVRHGDAWRHGLIEHFRGDTVAAARAYRRGIDAGVGDEPAERARLLGYSGSIAWLAGDLDLARDRATASLELATAAGDDGALAVAYTLAAMVAAGDGDRMGNDWHYVRALQHAERAGDLLQIARIRSNRGSKLMEEGEYAAALDELDDAVRHAEAGGYDGMLAIALTNRGEVQVKLGRLDDARTDLATAVDLLTRQGTSMVAYPLVQLARLFTARGDVEQARGACEQALAAMADSNDLQVEVAALTQLAQAVAVSDPDAAWDHAQRSASIATVALDAAEAWSTVARLALARGDAAAAGQAAARATDLARTRRDRFALATAIEVQAEVDPDPAHRHRLLGEALALFDEVGCPIESGRVEILLAADRLDALAVTRVAAVAEQARRLGARPLLARAEELLERHRTTVTAALSVTALGSFALALHGEPIPVKRWQSKKARDLFKMLVIRGGRPLPRDVAIERLWPDDEPSKVSSKLSVALATMRAVLDPDKEFAADHYVRAEGDAIVLDPSTLTSDVDQFLQGAASALSELRRHRGERAVAMLAAAEARYTGDVFEDDPYLDWFVPLREEARAVYLNVTSELAGFRATTGDLDDAIRLYLRLLEREPYDEAAHTELVRALSSVGRHGDARRRYQHYADRMRELDLEPRSFAAVTGRRS